MLPHYLNIQPDELKFPFELSKQIPCSLQLFNTTDNNVAFKIKTTSAKKYTVKPNAGIVLPGMAFNVTVTLQAQREAPPDMQCKDKFLIQSILAPAGFTVEDFKQDMFDKGSGTAMQQSKIKVVYVSPPQLASPISESIEEEISPESSPPREKRVESPLADVIDSNGAIELKDELEKDSNGAIELKDELKKDSSSAIELKDELKKDSNGAIEFKDELEKILASVARLIEEKKAASEKTDQLRTELATVALYGSEQSADVAESWLGFSFFSVFFVGFVGLLIGYFLQL